MAAAIFEDPKDPVSLKVLTLNCWGLYAPISKWRQERMLAIAEFLVKGDYDIVLLQEVWVKRDYEHLCDKLLKVMPYTHYFHSGMMGSGLCVFSRHSILETFQHSYSLKGFAHKIYHGDWFAGKAVGLVQINFNGFLVHVYVTHTHADYGDPPRYKTLRIVQAHELSEFIKLTSQGCDAVIVGGDFNFKPSDLGFKIVSSNANLQDAWLCERPAGRTEEDSWTCNPKGSPFAHDAGARIDYLLYKSNKGVYMTCDLCNTTMKQVPNKPYFYSDHTAVEATFTLHPTSKTSMRREDFVKSVEYLKEALPYLEKGKKTSEEDQWFYGFAALACLLAVVFFPGGDMGLSWIFNSLRLLITLLLGFTAWMCLIACSKEVNAYTAAIKDINTLIITKSKAIRNP